MKPRGSSVAFALVTAAALALPLWILVGGVVERFYAPLDRNGLTPANPSTIWPVSGVPAPTVAWWGDDPTGSGGKTTHAFTLTGSTETINTPFCRDGSFSDITTGDCMKAQRFDGVNDWYVADSDFSDPLANDFTACAVYRQSASGAGSDVAFGKLNSVANAGWAVFANSGACNGYFDDGPNSRNPAAAVTTYYGQWVMCCTVRDYDGNVFAFANGTAGGTVANNTGSIDVADNVQLGAQDATHANKFAGGIALGLIWPTTALTTTQLAALYNHFLGVLDTHGAPLTFSNTGPVCSTVDGQLECYGDDFATLGSELPPGFGSTGPASGWQITPTLTNSVIQSDNLAVTWVAIDGGGAAVVSAAATSPYRDGRAVSRLTDDQAGTIEMVRATTAPTNLNIGDKMQLCMWARDDSGTVLDVRFQEANGCGGSSTDKAAATITTTWKRYCWEHTLLDDACANVYVYIAPADMAAAANTGTADIGAVEFYMNNNTAGGQAWVPVHFCPTTTAAVTCGADLAGYTITGKGVVNGSGALVGEVRMSMQFAPATGDNLVSGYVMVLAKDTADYWTILHHSDEALYNYDGTNHGISAGYSTAGTLATVKASANYDSDQYWIQLNTDARVTDTTADTSPTGITTLRFGSRNASATAETAGFWIKSAKVEH